MVDVDYSDPTDRNGHWMHCAARSRRVVIWAATVPIPAHIPPRSGRGTDPAQIAPGLDLVDRFQFEDVDLEVVGDEVFDAAAELAAVGAVHRRFEHRAEAPFAERLDGPAKSDVQCVNSCASTISSRLWPGSPPRRADTTSTVWRASTSSCVESVADRSAITPMIPIATPIVARASLSGEILVTGARRAAAAGGSGRRRRQERPGPAR